MILPALMRAEVIKTEKDFFPLSLKEALQLELTKRCEKRPGYSLRAFSRSLQISPSSLSRILRGERTVSQKKALKLANQLGLGPLNIENHKSGRIKKTKDFANLELEKFAVISDWYHFAILELTQVSDFQSDPRWVAKKLNLTVSEVNIAISRLKNLGLIAETNGKLTNISGNNTTLNDSKYSSSAARKMQKQILQQALTAVDEVPVTSRNQTSMTMAISTARLPEAIACIKKFRREMSHILEQDSKKDAVYQLSVSLFPITRIDKEKNSEVQN